MIGVNPVARALSIFVLVLAILVVPVPLIAQSRSDFNGDGVSDLAIGAPYESVDGVPLAGAINVIYGVVDPRVTPGPPLRVDGNQFWTQNRLRVGPSETGDEFGLALAAGDFNGDGRSDLAVGAPGEDFAAGAVLVIYGSAAGLDRNNVQWWTQSVTGRGVSERRDRFGHSLVAADFNGDGRADLAIGVPGENDRGGAVNILYGSTAGLATTGSQVWTQDSASIAGAAETGDWFGATLAAADFGKSMHADLAIGVPFEDLGGATDAGAVHVLYGSLSGLTATGSQMWSQDSPGITGEAESGDQFGSALAAGNLGLSRHADLAIGVPGEDLRGNWVFVTPPPVRPDAGAVNVLYGANEGLSSGGSHRWSRNDLSFGGALPDEQFGYALAIGDFGRSAWDDLAIGVPGSYHKEAWEDSPTLKNVGSVVVLYGSRSGLSGNDRKHLSQADTSATREGGDRFGATLAAANFGGSAHADLAIGVPRERVGDLQSAGVVHVFYGTADGLTRVGNQIWSQLTPGMTGRAQRGDQFGRALMSSGR